MIATSFALGIVLGFVFFELSGLTAGGIVVPGYLALFIHDPMRIVFTLLISLLTYWLIYMISNYTILYGRRRFFMMIIAGFLLHAGFDAFRIYIPEAGAGFQAIGYIIPGLIANEFYRQGVLKTLASMAIVVTIVYFILSLIYF